MEKTRQIIVGLLLVLAACIADTPRPTRELMTLFQEAQYQEQTAGDLDKAIDLYEQVLAEAAEVDRLAARAAFQLAVCHQKKSDTAKAVEYFQKVVKEFPSQKALAGRAQEMLDKIAPASAQPSGDYVIHYKAVDPSQDALELLNAVHPKGVLTFRFRQYQADGQRLASICTDTEDGKNKLVEAINNSNDLKLVKVESPQQMTDVYRQKLQQPVTVNVSASPDGDRLTIQYAAIAIAEAAGVPYQWDKSAQMAHPQRTRYIEPLKFEGKPAAQALTDLLALVELEYGLDANGLYLRKLTGSDEPLTLAPAPWVDGEVMRLNLATPAGMDIGEIIYTAKAEQTDNAPVWVIESYMNVPISNTQQYTLVRAEAESFTPSFGLTKNQMGEFSAVYGDNKVDLTTTKGGSEKTQSFTPEQMVYDNEQALYLIRRMPLTEDYSGSFYIFPVQSASVARVQIDVKGRESRTVAAGTFDCWKVVLAVYAGQIKALEHTLWFSADTHKYLVRYDSGQAIMELKETTVKSDRPERLTFDGIGFELPAGWYAMKNPAVGGYRLGVQIIPPAMESWAVLTAAERIPLMESAQMVADMDIEQLKGYFDNYTVRQESRQDLTLDGMQATSFVADYSDDGDKVEYRTYILGSGVYWFVFRTDKEKFETQKPIFDAIVQSFGKTQISRSQKLKAEDLVAEGWKLWQDRKLAEAEKKFEEAAAADPTHDGAYQGLGWAQLNQGKHANARVSFEKCVALNPKNSAALNGLGWIAHGQDDKDEAIGWWEKAVAAQPGATASLSGLTQVYMERQDYPNAIRCYQLWLKAEPNNQDAKDGLEKARKAMTEAKK